MKSKLKIGDKVRHIHDNTEGRLTYSSFGASICGFTYHDEQGWYHFQTIGQPIENYESEWKRIYKYKYDMARWENGKENEH